MYTVKYRLPGQWFWRKIKGVKGDGIEGGTRFFLLEDDGFVLIPIYAEVRFPPQRNAEIKKKMDREAGQTLVRAE